MSSLSMVDYDTENLPKVPPADVSNLMAAWWLTIGFSLLVFLAILPMAPSPLVQNETITPNGWIAFALLAVVLVGVGAFVGFGLKAGKPSALRFCKLGLILGVILTLLAVAGVLVSASGNQPAGAGEAGTGPIPLGPAPMLGIILLAFLVLLPIFFAILAFSMAGTMAVKEWFTPPEETQASYGSEEAAAGGGWAAAGAGLAAGGVGAAYLATADDRGAVAHEPTVTYDAPPAHDEAFDAAFDQEIAQAPQTYKDPARPTMVASEEELAAAEAHPEVEFTPEAVSESSLRATPEALVEESGARVMPEPPPPPVLEEVEVVAEADADDVVYVEEADAEDVEADEVEDDEAVEYVEVEEVEAVEEVEEELPSASAEDSGDGTHVEPVDTWNPASQEEDERKNKRK